MQIKGRLLRNIASALATRGINLAASIVIVPLLLAELGPHGYGVLAIILSATIFFSYADLGLALAVVNVVSSPTESPENIRSTVNRVWWILCAISIATSLIGIAALITLSFWMPALRTHLFAWIVAVASISASIPTGLVQRILFAQQRGLTSGLWNAAARIASAAAVWFAMPLNLPLEYFSFAVLGIPAVVGWLCVIYFFGVNSPALRPGFSIPHPRHWGSDLKAGLSFTVLQLGVYVETGLDNALIGAFYSATVVAHYDLLARLFNYIPALVSIGAFPLWPALRNANLGKAEAQRLMLAAYTTMAGIVIPLVLALILWHDAIIELWTGQPYERSASLATALGLFTLLTCAATIQGMALNSRNLITTQARTQLITLPILLTAKSLALSAAGVSAAPVMTSLTVLGRSVYYSFGLRRR
ncbi:lipopolysaccharide biosynthesis protein [Phenylobacterium sp. J367]|uniref:lipopolysaccharide biosynthesis protein n=1 Tax=Phenylobacterium sp. J367 TaxID=2898435 RepID=UPI00215103D2|nr:oligosaccharide flippase family protein [Phenylobacterium sp. J367]MCR5879508.1 oligosaccharide flippase family protein [Phenylobacterium sp. J367]